MADFDLGGLLFGNSPSTGFESYLDPEQLKAMRDQGVMQAAMSLLRSSGPSRVPISIGQALGEAYGAGQTGYQQAQTQGIAGLLTKQKLDEAKRAQLMQENYTKMLSGLIGGQTPEAGVMDAESALAAPVTAQLPAGPTVARSEMIGQPTRSLGSPAVGGAAIPRGNLTPQMVSLLSMMPMTKGLEELYKLAQPSETQGQAFKAEDGKYYIYTKTGGVIPAPIAPADLGAEEYGAPVAQIVNGQIQMVQYNKKGEGRIAKDTMPYEPQSQDIRSVEYLLGKQLGGTGAAGMGQVGQYRQTLAPKTTFNVDQKQQGAFEAGLGKGQSERILANQVVAQDAAAILETNQVGRDLLKSGAITGTGANFFVGFNNALKQAGVDFGYANAAANSQAYAAAMGANVGRIIKQFGAGTGLSDADREYAAQMAGGKISLTEASLRKILDINDKAANRVIDLHNKNVAGIKTNIPLTVDKPTFTPPPPAAASQIPGGAPVAQAGKLSPAEQTELDQLRRAFRGPK